MMKSSVALLMRVSSASSGSPLVAFRCWIPGPVLRDRARIDAKIDPRDHRRVVGSEKRDGFSIVIWTRQFLHRHAIAKWIERLLDPIRLLAAERFAAPSRGALERFRRISRRRREAVDANAVPNQFHGRRTREVQQPALAGAVSDIFRLALMTRSRNNIDDAALAAL